MYEEISFVCNYQQCIILDCAAFTFFPLCCLLGNFLSFIMAAKLKSDSSDGPCVCVSVYMQWCWYPARKYVKQKVPCAAS